MKHLVLTLAALSAATSIAACSKKEAAPAEAVAPVATAAAPAAPSSGMADMPMAAGETMAKSAGTVTSVTDDTVTIDHAAIPEAKWPAMTMTFKASPDIAKQVKAGDKVAFDVKLKDGGGEVTAIRRP